jgi:hypothetical protein
MTPFPFIFLGFIVGFQTHAACKLMKHLKDLSDFLIGFLRYGTPILGDHLCFCGKNLYFFRHNASVVQNLAGFTILYNLGANLKNGRYLIREGKNQFRQFIYLIRNETLDFFEILRMFKELGKYLFKHRAKI